MTTRIALNGNNQNWLIGIGEGDCLEVKVNVDWQKVDDFIAHNKGKHLFVTLSYDLGFELLPVNKKNKKRAFPLMRIWTAEAVFSSAGNGVAQLEGEINQHHEKSALSFLTTQNNEHASLNWKARTPKADYLAHLNALKNEIQFGNIYEINYCQEFYVANCSLQSMQPLYTALNAHTLAPFSACIETENWMLACASPERFIQKVGNRLISQPIKGTAARNTDPVADEALKVALQASQKERSENVMIVDLVRNDLSKIATKGSVEVTELFGIYSFPTVHQMISTVACDVQPNTSFSAIIAALFPMGSMTGAPKISAMNLSEEHEDFARELYSGSIGVIYPSGDFDLNVVIRSLFYDVTEQRLSVGVGGAITINSDPESEYLECKTKVGKILSLFGSCEW
jgi:para-aminobenzoate synthetase component 1